MKVPEYRGALRSPDSPDDQELIDWWASLSEEQVSEFLDEGETVDEHWRDIQDGRPTRKTEIKMREFDIEEHEAMCAREAAAALAPMTPEMAALRALRDEMERDGEISFRKDGGSRTCLK